MSPLTTIWPMISGACLMLCFMHLLLWWRDRRRRFFAFSAIMALASAFSALVEMQVMRAETIPEYVLMQRAETVMIGVMLVAMTWFVSGYLGTGRRWLAVAITGLWTVCLIFNATSPASLVFSEITELAPRTTFWGETFTVAVGKVHPAKYLSDLASLLVMIFVLDATFRAWRAGRHRAAVTVGGSIGFFIVAAGIHTPLVDVGIVETPYLISVAFVAILSALTYEVADDAARSREYRRDLDRTRRRLDRLVRAGMLGELVSALSHELNQPLAAILSNAQAARLYLAQDEPRIDEVRTILDQIVRDEKRAATVIERLEALLVRGEVNRETLDLDEVVREVVALVGPEYGQQRAALDLTVATGLAPASAGRVEVQQVVLNLLLNALRALEDAPPERRSVMISLGDADGWVLVSVRDTGPGLVADQPERIFEPFHSGHEGHIGMGLAICRRIVEGYGGRIAAENAADGGARFWFTLPVARTERRASHG